MSSSPGLFSAKSAKPLRLEDLASATSQVLTINEGRVALLTQTKGGWEGWLQGELSLLLLELGHDVEREARVYGDTRAADLVVGDCVIELKALGLARDVGPFFDGVDVDVAKLQALKGTFGTRLGVTVVPGFGPDVFNYARKRLAGWTHFNRLECASQFNVFGIRDP